MSTTALEQQTWGFLRSITKHNMHIFSMIVYLRCVGLTFDHVPPSPRILTPYSPAWSMIIVKKNTLHDNLTSSEPHTQHGDSHVFQE
jgi:hypothetical protein